MTRGMMTADSLSGRRLAFHARGFGRFAPDSSIRRRLGMHRRDDVVALRRLDALALAERTATIRRAPDPVDGWPQSSYCRGWGNEIDIAFMWMFFAATARWCSSVSR